MTTLSTTYPVGILRQLGFYLALAVYKLTRPVIRLMNLYGIWIYGLEVKLINQRIASGRPAEAVKQEFACDQYDFERALEVAKMPAVNQVGMLRITIRIALVLAFGLALVIFAVMAIIAKASAAGVIPSGHLA